MAVKRKRGYRSPKREAQARATRERVARAGRKLFARQGYAATTLQAVAAEAGVAVQTVYATYGSKRAILSELLRQMEKDADIADLPRQVAAQEDPREQLRLGIGSVNRIFDRGLDVVEIVRGAATADAHLASAWRKGEARRRQGQRNFIRMWSARGVLRSDLSEREATDILWALTGEDVFRLLRVESGWSAARYVRRLHQILVPILFRSDVGRPVGRA